MNRSVGSRCMVVILRICWHEFSLRFDQALGLSGWSAFTRPWRPKYSLTRRCGDSPFQIAIGRDPELPGDLLLDLPNVIAAHTAL